MYRLLILLLALTLLPFAGTAEAPLTFAEDLSGVYTWPEGAAEEDASYVYRYRYPQISGDSDLAMTINEIFKYEVAYALDFDCPMNGSNHPAEDGQMLVDISYAVTHLSNEYLSIRIDKTVTVGDQIVRVIKANTFGLTGSHSGTVTALPYLLGIITKDTADEWLIERQTAKVDACVRDMVWALIEADMKIADSPIYDDLTLEEFEWSFYPEEDFYLDDTGSFVFFIQEGTIAPTEAGQFFYTISRDELLDEI